MSNSQNNLQSHKISGYGLTFDDVLICPRQSNILPREAVLQTQITRGIRLNIPLLSAAMDTVTEYKLAIALAREGGLGIIHKNLSIEEQSSQVAKVKRSEGFMITDPITLPPDVPLAHAIAVMNKYNISGIPVVNDSKLIGMLTHRDIRFAEEDDLPISKLMTPSDKTTKLIHLINGQFSGAHVYFLFRALFCEEGVATLFSDQSVKHSEIIKNLKKTQELIDSKSELAPVNLISYLELTQYMANNLLRDTDMMSMAHGLEVRVPLIDHKLIELMFSIPHKFKNDQVLPKGLLVKSLKRKLPESLVRRKKMGFTLPSEIWMRGNMKSEIESVLLTPTPKLSDIISEEGIKKVWIDFMDRRCSWSRPWSLYVLKKWVESNL